MPDAGVPTGDQFDEIAFGAEFVLHVAGIPEQRTPCQYDALAAFGAALDRVERADVVLFDGRAQQDFAAGAEVLFARMRGIPVVALCPENSPYRDSVDGDSPDPMLLGLCDHVARTWLEALAWARARQGAPTSSARDPQKAMEYFRSVVAS